MSPIQQMLLGTGASAPPGQGGDNVSVSFDGSNDYLAIPDSSVFALGTDDLTIECFYKAASGASGYDCIVSFGWKFQLYMHSGKFQYWCQGSSSYFINGENTGTSSVSTGVWYHVAVTRSGSTFRIFLNGVEKSSATSSTAFGDPEHDIAIGRFGPNSSYYAQGLTSNFRFTRGQALYTSNFTKPSAVLTTTSQGATASNVKLLCCNITNTPAGSTVTPSTITNNGATASSDGPF